MSTEPKYQVEITVVERVTFKRIVEMTAAEFAHYDTALSDKDASDAAMEELSDKYSVSSPDNWFDSDLEEVDITHMPDAA